MSVNTTAVIALVENVCCFTALLGYGIATTGKDGDISAENGIFLVATFITSLLWLAAAFPGP